MKQMKLGKPFETILQEEDKKLEFEKDIDAQQTGRSTDIRWHV
jgi:hypothetical protein